MRWRALCAPALARAGTVAVLAGTIAVLGAGCSDDDGTPCEPGAERLCQCDGGAEPGVQRCDSSGEWGPCEQCTAQTCGDGTCDPDEDAASCPQDCDDPFCGDGTCDPGEDTASCPQDCDGPRCGDGTCDPGEDDVSCPADCESPCGDGHVTAGEACDASNLNGHDCTTLGQGFSGGTLACAADCTFDTSGCVSTPGCGNHVKEGSEACDGDDFGGQTCADLDPAFTGGRLACRPDCSAIVTRGCHAIAPCGDGTAQWPEECDGADLQGLTACTDYDPGFSGGSLSCTEHCTLDFSACQGDLCAAAGMYGTGYCDPCVLYGGTPDPDCQSCTQTDGDCVSWMAPGVGDVLTSCEYATGQQDPDCGTCGDGQVNPATEWCDAALGVPAGPQCSDFGFTGGELGCTAACVLDVSGCTSCGNGQIDGPEECDGANLASTACTDLGFSGGALSCSAACTFDLSGCTGGCGNGVQEGSEACDGADVGSATCQTEGYDAGTLGCDAACSAFDTRACYGDFVVDDTLAVQWVDLTATGNALSLGDDEIRGPFPIGFPFYLYGTAHTQLHISSNGFVTLSVDGDDPGNACPLSGDTLLPDAVIAPMWDDLDPSYYGDPVYYESFGSCPVGPAEACLVVQYQGYHHYDLSTPLPVAGTFELILFESGSVLLQYQDAGDQEGSSATTGIKGPGGLGADYGCDTPGYLSDGLAICFERPGSSGC